MPKICSTVETWVTQVIIEPLENWITQQEEKCKKKKWWNPATWVCWFITILVKVITWVTKTIVIKSTVIICVFIAWVIGTVLGWIPWINDWFSSCFFELKEKKQLPNGETSFTYYCRCNKNCNDKTEVIVTAKDINEANELAKKECNSKC